MRFGSLLIPAVLLSFSLAAHADTTYNYTGQNFTDVFGPFTTSESITGSFTVSSPLGDNLDEYAISPASFSFSNGVDTITNANAAFVVDFNVSTNASGEIDDWDILLLGDDATIEIEGGPQFDDGDYIGNSEGYGENFVSGSFASDAPVSVTPEPSSFVLLGTGLLGVCGVMRRRLV